MKNCSTSYEFYLSFVIWELTMKKGIVILIFLNLLFQSDCGFVNMRKIDNCYTNNISMIVEKCWVRELTVTLVARILAPIHKIEVSIIHLRHHYHYSLNLSSLKQFYRKKKMANTVKYWNPQALISVKFFQKAKMSKTYSSSRLEM